MRSIWARVTHSSPPSRLRPRAHVMSGTSRLAQPAWKRRRRAQRRRRAVEARPAELLASQRAGHFHGEAPVGSILQPPVPAWVAKRVRGTVTPSEAPVSAAAAKPLSPASNARPASCSCQQASSRPSMRAASCARSFSAASIRRVVAEPEVRPALAERQEPEQQEPGKRGCALLMSRRVTSWASSWTASASQRRTNSSKASAFSAENAASSSNSTSAATERCSMRPTS